MVADALSRKSQGVLALSGMEDTRDCETVWITVW